MPRIFISCVTAEFGAYRVRIAKYLARANCEVKFQENFSHSPYDTIEKLDEYIRSCDAVIHILGMGAGAMADSRAVAAYFAKEPAFVQKMSDIGDFRTLRLSYTQWEAYLAGYHEKKIFVYKASEKICDGHPTKACGFESDGPVFEPSKNDAELVAQHCTRLLKLPNPRFTVPFKDLSDLNGQFIGDLRELVGTKAQLSVIRSERFGTHKVDELKDVLRAKAGPLLEEGFVLTAFVQITGSTPEEVGMDRQLDLVLVDILAEWKSPHELLALVKACQTRSEAMGLVDLASSLSFWFSQALKAFNVEHARNHEADAEDLTEIAITGRCAEAFHHLGKYPLPTPCLEVAWRQDPSTAQTHVLTESYLRWGRCHERVGFKGAPVPASEVPTLSVRTVRNSSRYRRIPFERIEVFVSQRELNRPWEYVAGCKPDDDDPRLHPWPAVLRLLGRELVFGPVKSPPDPIRRKNFACLLGKRDTFMEDVRARGGFFAAPDGTEDYAKDISRAVIRASIGFWLRNAKAVNDTEKCFDELDGSTLASVPRLVFEKKHDSCRDSPWRDLSLFYDHPEWPGFEFSTDQYAELVTHEEMLDAHGIL